MIKETEVIKIFKTILVEESKAILEKSKNIDSSIFPIIQKILSSPSHSRIITTGVGKSGFIAQKFAATLASTGSLSFFLNPLDALHGDLGMIHQDDIIFGISQSGQSDELCKIFEILSNNVKISLTGNESSKLSTISDFHILNKTTKEACYLNLAPTTSTTLALSICDAIAISLMKLKNFDKYKFSKSHPLGSLGKRLNTLVSDIMTSEKGLIPVIDSNKSVAETIVSISKYEMGFIIIINNQNTPIGIFTDGDLRRILKSSNLDLLLKSKISNHMNTSFIKIKSDLLLVNCLNQMKKNKITSFPVENNKGELVGAINIRQIINHQI